MKVTRHSLTNDYEVRFTQEEVDIIQGGGDPCMRLTQELAYELLLEQPEEEEDEPYDDEC